MLNEICEEALMHLLRIYYVDNSWWADWLVGCDIYSWPITFAEALSLEVLL